MKSKPLWISVLAAGIFAAAGYGLYTLGMQRGMDMGGAAPGPQSTAEGEAATRRHIQAGLKAGDVDPMTGKKILYYHDPMVPGNKFDKPGKSPFMDLSLIHI